MTESYAPALVEAVGPSSGALLRRRIFTHKGLLIGSTLLAIVLLMALLAPLIAPHDPYAQDLTQRMIRRFGTKRVPGRMCSAPTISAATTSRASSTALGISLLIGFAVMMISGLIGAASPCGRLFRGRTDMVVTFFITIRLAMPVILVALAVVAMVGGSLWVVVLVLGLLKWDRFAVVMRAATQQVRSLDYVTAAAATGASTPRIVVGEVLPNVLPQLIVVASVEAASAILLEAALSFLGLGVQPPLPSWGLMIAEAKAYMFFSFWLIAIPGTALALLVLAINMVGDGIRDVSAPSGGADRGAAAQRIRPHRRPRHPARHPARRARHLLDINAGETLCLVGESGCGKSMTALALMGLLPNSATRRARHLAFEGGDLANVTPRKLASLRAIAWR